MKKRRRGASQPQTDLCPMECQRVNDGALITSAGQKESCGFMGTT